MAFMDINLTGAIFTDYHLLDVGSGTFQLDHDWFVKQSLVIRTAPAGGGTLLVEGTDYTLTMKSQELSDRVSAAVASTSHVYHEITIINATYQTGDLYFSGKYIADSNAAGDMNALQTAAAAHAALTNPHSATAAPTADRLMLRDGAGRAQVVAPSAAADIARKDTVDTHAALSAAGTHGSTTAAIANKLVHRDANGRALAAAPLLHVQDQKPAGTAGGTFTSGAWQTRTLNTVLTNEITGASLTANQITLPPGTYEARFSCPAQAVNRHRAILYNVTASADLVLGQSGYADVTNYVENCCVGFGRFTLAVESVVELRHLCQTTKTTDGFGVAFTFGAVEIYSEIEIRKVA